MFLGLSVVVLAEAIHGIVFGLVEENGRFCAASFMVWMYCELPDSPVSNYFRRQREAASASERAKRTCHVVSFGGEMVC